MPNNDINTRASESLIDFLHVSMQFLRETHHLTNHGFGRSQGQGQIIDVLKDYEQITQKELVKLLDMTPQSASEMIKKLEKRGFIERERDPDDGRGYILCLTVKGRVEANQSGDFNPIMLESLTDEEKEQLSAILNKINNDMESKLRRTPRRRRIEGRHL